MTNLQLRIRVAESMGDKCERCNGTGQYLRFGPHEWFRRGEGKEQQAVPCDHLTIDFFRSHHRLYPKYDTDANLALLLVARLKEQGWIFILSQQPDGKWFATFVHAATDRYAKATEETMPMAVATAFLATQGETKL